MAHFQVAPHQRWRFIDFVLYEIATLGRRHVRDWLPGPRPPRACCGLEEDGWMHLWGRCRPEAGGRGVFAGDGCPTPRRWSGEENMWVDEAIWRRMLFCPVDKKGVRNLARLIATVARMYRWARYGEHRRTEPMGLLCTLK